MFLAALLLLGLTLGVCILFGSPVHTFKSLRSEQPLLNFLLPFLTKVLTRDKTRSFEVEDLVKIRPWGYGVLKRISIAISFYRIVPFLVGMGVILRYGPDKLWRFPFDRYVLWDWMILIVTFIEIHSSNPVLGIIISIVIIASNFISIFFIDNGLDTQPHKFGLIRNLANGLSVVMSYGLLFLSIDKTFNGIFSRSFSNEAEALLFSFSQASFGQLTDVIPTVNWVKFVVLSESLFSFGFAGIFLAVYIPDWREAKRKLQTVPKADQAKASE
jgi:hypothetical protein